MIGGDFSSDPYPGLRPFRQKETDIFFGREEHTDQLLERLANHRFLAVTGLSGCGKSSLVRAGLIPALNRGFVAKAGCRWRVAEMRPGRTPFGRLAAGLLKATALASEREGIAGGAPFVEETLRRGPMGLVEALRQTPPPGGTNLLVVVDQFEEIFRFRTEDEGRDAIAPKEYQRQRQRRIDEAEAFVQLLLASKEQVEFPVFVLLTMRTDYLGHCAVFRGLLEVINESQYIPPPLSREQLIEAISGPAQVLNGSVEETLCHRLLNDAGSSQDQLPLLQHVLMRMWNFAKKQQVQEANQNPILLTVEHYATVGSIRPSADGDSALSRHGREVLDHLGSEKQHHITEMLFRALSGGAAERHDTRRFVSVQEVAAIAEVEPTEVMEVADIFRALGCNFITAIAGERPSGELQLETELDISHESLIRHWDKLKGWVDREARAGTEYRRLVGEEARYHTGQRAELTALEFQNALAWQRDFSPNPSWARRYGGDYQRIETFLAKSGQAAKRERWKNLLGRLSILAGIAIVIMGGLTCWALRERQGALKQNDEAKKNLAQALTYKALLEWQANKPLSAIAYLPQIKRLGGDLPASADLGGVFPPKIRWHHLVKFSGPLFAIALSANQRWLATVTENEQIEIMDPMTSESISTVQISELTGGQKAGDSKRLIRSVRLAFHPEGEWLAVQAGDSLGFLKYREGAWVKMDPAENKLARLASANKKVLAFAVSPKADMIAAAVSNEERSVQLNVYKEDGSTIVATSSGDPHNAAGTRSLAFSPDGNQIASVAGPRLVIFDTKTGAQLARLEPARGASPAGANLYETEARTSDFYSVAYHPDGVTLAVGNGRGKVSLWRLKESADSQGSTATNPKVATSPSLSGANPLVEGQSSQSPLSPRQLVSLDRDSPDRAADMEMPAEHRNSAAKISSPLATVTQVAFGPSGEYVAWITGDSYLNFWFFNQNGGAIKANLPPLEKGPEEFFLKADPKKVTGFALSSSGKFAVTVSSDSAARFWEIASEEKRWSESSVIPPVEALCVGAGDVITVAGKVDGGLGVWRGGRYLSTIMDQLDSQRLLRPRLQAYTQNGRRMVFAEAQVLQMVDLDTGRSFPEIRAQPVLDIDPTGKVLALKGSNTVELWDAEQGIKLGQLGEGIYDASASFANQHPWLAVGDRLTGRVIVWDFQNAQNPLKMREFPATNESDAHNISFSPDDIHLGWVGNKGTVNVCEVQGNQRAFKLPREKYNDDIETLQFSADGKHIALGKSNGELVLWSFEAEPLIFSITQTHQEDVSALVCASDGSLLSGSRDQTVKKWKEDGDHLVEIGSLQAQDWRPLKRDQATVLSGLLFEKLPEPTCLDQPNVLGQAPSDLRDQSDLAGFWRASWDLVNSNKNAVLDEEEASNCNNLQRWLGPTANAPASILQVGQQIQKFVRGELVLRHSVTGREALLRRDDPKALDEFKRAHDLAPEQDDLTAFLAFLYHQNGDEDRSDQLRKKLGQHGRELMNFGNRFLTGYSNSLEASEIVYSYWIWASPEEPTGFVSRGKVRLLLRGRSGDAIADLRTALTMFEEKPKTSTIWLAWTRFVLARAYRAAGDAQSAEVELQRCVQIKSFHPDRAKVLRFQAFAKALLGNFSGAEDDCRAAMNDDPGDISNPLYFACVYALEAENEPAGSEARLRKISSAVAQLKSVPMQDLNVQQFLKQFDDLEIFETLSQSAEFQESLRTNAKASSS